MSRKKEAARQLQNFTLLPTLTFHHRVRPFPSSRTSPTDRGWPHPAVGSQQWAAAGWNVSTTPPQGTEHLCYQMPLCRVFLRLHLSAKMVGFSDFYDSFPIEVRVVPWETRICVSVSFIKRQALGGLRSCIFSPVRFSATSRGHNECPISNQDYSKNQSKSSCLWTSLDLLCGPECIPSRSPFLLFSFDDLFWSFLIFFTNSVFELRQAMCH